MHLGVLLADIVYVVGGNELDFRFLRNFGKFRHYSYFVLYTVVLNFDIVVLSEKLFVLPDKLSRLVPSVEF